VIRGIDPPEVEGYQWDGWKLIMIAKLNSNGTFHSRKWSCVWRPDIGSSLYARNDWMRAGGVGGLAWLQTGAVQSYSYGTGSGEVHVPLADHMGNVRHYYQFKASGKTVTGQLVASYEYDAFGREVRAWGTNTPATNQPPGLPANRPWADLLPFHYSSKLRDADSGFNYYGYRFYDPGAGRWLNRDPIGEEGGLNLYGMVGNDGVNDFDILGWNPWVVPPSSMGAAYARQIQDFGKASSPIVAARSMNGSRAYHPALPKVSPAGPFLPGKPKCNQFVADCICSAEGFQIPFITKGENGPIPPRIPRASEWVDKEIQIPGFGPPHSNPQPGDVVSNGSHMGIRDVDGVWQASSRTGTVYLDKNVRYYPIGRTPICCNK
jgi:RHS repeat-associated protein